MIRCHRVMAIVLLIDSAIVVTQLLVFYNFDLICMNNLYTSIYASMDL